MKIFICHKSVDNNEAEKVIEELLKVSDNSIAILRETDHSENWKNLVESKFRESDFILFLLGSETFKSEQIIWEYAKAKQLNKQIVGIKLTTASEDSIIFCQGFQVFENEKQCVKYLEKVFESDRQLLLEQYKIMVASTEKVTEQRMKVNNLFFTVTSTILSITLVIGKTFEFSLVGAVGMLIITFMAFLVTFFWERLVNSYGKLNTGKFLVIDRIEKQLRTNMFEYEWNVLTKEIKYAPNTKTEVKVIQRFRIFIIIIFIIELVYLLYKVLELYPICNK